MDAVEEWTAIQLCDQRSVASIDGLRERLRIDANVARDHELVGVRFDPVAAHGLADLIQALPQRVPRVLGVALRPEQRGQRLARDAALDGQIDEQGGAGVLAEESVETAVVVDRVQATKGDQLAGHGLSCRRSSCVASRWTTSAND